MLIERFHRQSVITNPQRRLLLLKLKNSNDYPRKVYIQYLAKTAFKLFYDNESKPKYALHFEAAIDLLTVSRQSSEQIGKQHQKKLNHIQRLLFLVGWSLLANIYYRFSITELKSKIWDFLRDKLKLLIQVDLRFIDSPLMKWRYYRFAAILNLETLGSRW